LKLLYSTTSPYARVVRIALAEKGLTQVEGVLTDPWKDGADLLAANPSARVPALQLDCGRSLTESLLIVMWLETQKPAPSLLGADASGVMSKAGVAMGAIDAAAAVIIGRKMTDASFDESPVGLRRRRSVIAALSRLEAEPPSVSGDGVPDLAVIATVVLLDYVRFRFTGASWMPSTPQLDHLAEQLRNRPSFADSAPRDMPRT
jgi:glutathione S-transferase